ncbi:alcohol dehydrogenase catalytic domain-containing protein [Alkalihalobacillus sp. MEB130]|uniref:zinc-dependent alcohol dehydrogenase n=1 Tax=Alkalihalobacillus sp. MEB130 TaxID=2976704 RepID=UPI0028DF7F60|nr:alcohol dehydrogenase catalytic domain-containing protein [Alkalihalobacillus sp. MEB130]MDT8859646.1 alcohol dehydrogenase catalytic domain-containing protein [Alkalihalobacillus sp. MEB130]
MNALQFNFTIPKYVLTKTIGRWFPSIHWNPRVSCLTWGETDEPTLPNDDWAKIQVKYGGICGSDMNLLFLHDSPSTSPYVSFPFTIGHEAVGQIAEVGKNVTQFTEGQRVVVNPVLSCESRDLDPCPACKRGDESLCEQKTKGSIESGLLIGACKDTGGSWSPYFVAHKSQIIPLPDEVDDLNGVLVEPFSCALHAVLRNPPNPGDHVLVIGAGVIGLSVVAALKALEYSCRITVLVKHGFQGEMAKCFGADEVIFLDSSYVTNMADSLSAEVLKPLLGPEIVQGGANLVYECVGKKKSVTDALRFTQSGGTVVLLGLASIMKQVDWTTVWLNELTIKGCFAYSTNEFEGKKMNTLQIAIELMKRGKVDLSPLITHQYPLHDYKVAFNTITKRNSESALKVVFTHDQTTVGG